MVKKKEILTAVEETENIMAELESRYIQPGETFEDQVYLINDKLNVIAKLLAELVDSQKGKTQA